MLATFQIRFDMFYLIFFLEGDEIWMTNKIYASTGDPNTFENFQKPKTIKLNDTPICF